MNTVTKMNRFFNNVHLTDEDQMYVGIDTHKASYHVAFYLNGAAVLDFVMPPDPHQLIKHLEPVRQAVRQIAYEAGPTGYGLARFLRKHGFSAMVAATSKTPRPSAKENKTDRLDSKKLACYLAKDLLKPVALPSVRQEADRQLCRMQRRQSRLWARVKIQIKSFLLQHGLPEPAGLDKWSIRSVQTLRTMRLTGKLRIALDIFLADYDYHASRTAVIDKQLAAQWDQNRLGYRIALLRTHPGVGPVTARQFATELYHYAQFKYSRQVVKYIGLSPTIHQSGDKSSTGPINRDGKPALRSTLIQAAWQWVFRDALAKQYFRRICRNNGGIKTKAITAVARKLTVHLWTMLKNDEPYRQDNTQSC